MSKLIRMEFTAGEEYFDSISEILESQVLFGWQEDDLPTGETRYIIHCEQPEFINDLRIRVQALSSDISVSITEVDNVDWLASWREFFTPIVCNNFVVLPSWLKDDPLGKSHCPVLIEPKSAFGTGHHATTALCLKAISDLFENDVLHADERFFDLGTGSGILSIACCLKGMHGLASDIDPLAITNAQENAALNNVTNVKISSGSVEIAAGEHFDFVVANILANPLIAMAKDIHALLKPNGILLLSGILNIQANAVENAYRNCGLPAAKRFDDGEWTALLWQNK